MNNLNSIRHGDTTITYEVIRSQRRKKTIQTKVSLKKVRVLAPAHTSDGELEQLIRKQAGWILERRAVLQERPAPKQFVTGDTMPYLGENFELIVDTDRFLWPWIRFEEGRFLFDAPPNLGEEERGKLIRNAFVDWYRRQAEDYLPERVDEWLPYIAGYAHPRVLIRDQRRRWASCASDGTLRFNWRVIMLEPDLVDYLVVHELTHLLIRNHSPDFWEQVRLVMPDGKDRDKRLNKAGIALPPL